MAKYNTSSNKRDTNNTKAKKMKPEEMSIVTFDGVNFLDDRAVLLHTIHNHTHDYRNPGDAVDIKSDGDTVTCLLDEKNLALSLAKHIENTYKGNSAKMTVHNPEHNEFYRLVVTFYELSK